MTAPLRPEKHVQFVPPSEHPYENITENEGVYPSKRNDHRFTHQNEPDIDQVYTEHDSVLHEYPEPNSRDFPRNVPYRKGLILRSVYPSRIK